MKRKKFSNFELNCVDNSEKYLDNFLGGPSWRTLCLTPSYDHKLREYIEAFEFDFDKEKHKAATPFIILKVEV